MHDIVKFFLLLFTKASELKNTAYCSIAIEDLNYLNLCVYGILKCNSFHPDFHHLSLLASPLDTIKPRKFEHRFFKLLIRNKFGTHWIQSIGPFHDLF